MRIVIVEDEIRIREGISKLIGKIFPEFKVVASAANGKEGLDIILVEKPDLIIVDVKMPIMDGLEMLVALSEKKIKTKVIILSAYAEFSYAQQAIHLGVSEYLIKPLVPSKFVQAIKNIQTELAETQIDDTEILSRLDHILFGIIYGNIDIDKKLSYFLENKYGIHENTQFSQVQIYLGKQFIRNVASTRIQVEQFLKTRNDLDYCIVEIPKERMLLIVLYGYEDQCTIERWFQDWVALQKIGNNAQNRSYGWINAGSVKELKANYQKLLRHMDWNISFSNSVMISYPKILQVQTSICIYPKEIENQLKSALCSYKRDEVFKCIQQFNEYFDNENIYSPKEIKDNYVRFLWAMMSIGREIGLLDNEQIQQQKIYEQIMNAMNKNELSDIAKELFYCIKHDYKNGDEKLSLNVKRAENIIHEYYQTGITLEEIADELDLTPEYLGMQFHKEKGITFSTYIKEFRVAKAKKLLIGSRMKVYEIADKVGYSDAKYFSRVFRESIGMSPVEYRKTYR